MWASERPSQPLPHQTPRPQITASSQPASNAWRHSLAGIVEHVDVDLHVPRPARWMERLAVRGVKWTTRQPLLQLLLPVVEHVHREHTQDGADGRGRGGGRGRGRGRGGGEALEDSVDEGDGLKGIEERGREGGRIRRRLEAEAEAGDGDGSTAFIP